MSQLAICLIICVLTIASYAWAHFSMGTTAMFSMCLFLITKCVTAENALSYFGNANAIVIVSMVVVAAGFNKTQFVKNAAHSVNKMARNSFYGVMFGYLLIAAILGQFISVGIAIFTIIAPMLTASVEELGVNRSKAMYSLGITCVLSLLTFPIAAGATVPAELNGYLESVGYTDFTVGMLDPVKIRGPIVIIMFFYAVFIAPRFAPDKPPVEIRSIDLSKGEAMTEREKLPAFQEAAGYLIFFGVTAALLLQKKIGIPTWQIGLFGAMLMIATGVLSSGEAVKAIPFNIYFLYVGALSMGGALQNTGAGKAIGGALANIANSMHSTWLVYMMFFLAPFAITQVMNNRVVMLTFIPIVAVACQSLHANPVGAIVLVQIASLSAFATPMATATVPYFMAAGGYDVKSVLKQSVPVFIIIGLLAVTWTSILYPLY